MTPRAEPVLEVRDISVNFGGLRALSKVSLSVPRGRTVGLIGPNGAGKTTLFDTVLGLNEPSAGRVHLFGQDVTSWPMHRRARLGVGRTFQRLELFGSLSVIENVIVALESVSGVSGLVSELLRRPASIDVRTRAHGRAEELLDLVGLTEHADARTAELPMGLARILELARALATDPQLLMLDEPGSGLNEQETDRLADLIVGLRKAHDLSILLVEHDMTFVMGLAQNVYVLDFGRMIAHGTPAQIRRDAKVQSAYLGGEHAPARR